MINIIKTIGEEKHYCKGRKKNNIFLRMIDVYGIEFVECKKCNFVLFIKKR